MAPILYLIRHGEKPPKLADGEDAQGLSAEGLERAQGLVKVFGRDSDYNIGYIIAEKPKKDGDRTRPVETVTPLADSLGLLINDTISRDDVEDAAEAAKDYTGPGNVLVCWEHGVLSKIVESIGVKDAPGYPGDRFDLIWTIKSPYEEISSVSSEGVPGLDAQ